jgi:cell division protein FtsN
MSEPGFREIQLNTKQVVFLFIAGLAVLVGIFLLGVQAGRGVSPERAGETVQAPDPAADVTASGVMPPATSPKPDELKYHDELQNKGAAKGATVPPTPPDAPPEPAAKPTPTPMAKPTPTPTATPAASPPASAKPTPTPAAAKGTIYLQVDSFGERANANRQVAQLKAKNIAAFILEVPGPGPHYKVRVGPFPDLPAADAMKARLHKEGFNPSVIR